MELFRQKKSLPYRCAHFCGVYMISCFFNGKETKMHIMCWKISLMHVTFCQRYRQEKNRFLNFCDQNFLLSSVLASVEYFDEHLKFLLIQLTELTQFDSSYRIILFFIFYYQFIVRTILTTHVIAKKTMYQKNVICIEYIQMIFIFM